MSAVLYCLLVLPFPSTSEVLLIRDNRIRDGICEIVFDVKGDLVEITDVLQNINNAVNGLEIIYKEPNTYSRIKVDKIIVKADLAAVVTLENKDDYA